MRVAGTYEFALVDDAPAAVLDLPPGLNLEIVGIMPTSQTATTNVAPLFDRLAESIWMDTSP